MGSFYTNIHLRTTERETVERLWAAFWEARGEKSWAWVSPVYHGWVSVFDWQCDQGDTGVLKALSAHCSQALECIALAFQVQDSDLAQYWLFQAGEAVDAYTSNVHYFAAFAEPPETDAETQGIFAGYGRDIKPGYPTDEDVSDGGSPRKLRELVNPAADENELEAILRSPAVVADDILTALASTLGIHDTWAAVGYHYLLTEGDTIPGRDTFRHLPEAAPPHGRTFQEKAS